LGAASLSASRVTLPSAFFHARISSARFHASRYAGEVSSTASNAASASS
jgi:hypothetical protein